MGQGDRGLARHAAVSVSGTGDDTFKQAKHAAHFRIAVQGRHKMHLGRTGIGKAYIYFGIHQGLYQTLRAATVFVITHVCPC